MIIIFYNLVSLMDYKEWVKMNSLIVTDELMIKTLEQFYLLKGNIDSKKSFFDFQSIVNSSSFYTWSAYKFSVFNYWQHREKISIVFNTLYNTMCVLDNSEYKEFLNIDNINSSMRRLFIEKGLYVGQVLNEIDLYLNFSDVARKYQPRRLRLVIATTTKCNAHCIYCYEAGIFKQDFKIENNKDLINFITSQDISQGVHITWFGGEPLLNTNLIDYVTEELLKRNIKFSSYIITNGSLLNDDMLKYKFPYWHIKSMQITIDGTKDNYLKIKKYNNSSDEIYNKLIENIQFADELGIGVDIRLNIDKNNVNDIFNLVNDLSNRFFNNINISFYPAFIDGTDYDIDDNGRLEIVRSLLKDEIYYNKIMFIDKVYSESRIAPCNFADYLSFDIDVNGDIHTCEHYVGRSDNIIGTLVNGVICDQRYYQFKLADECKQCIWLPKCFGGCEARRREKNIPCMIEKYMIPAYIESLADKLEEQEKLFYF